jgi:Zn-dependent metalloprotease
MRTGHVRRRCPLHCFIPPHLHEGIAAYAVKATARATEVSRDRATRAISTLAVDHTMRALRLGFVEHNRPALSLARLQRGRLRWGLWGAASAGGQANRTIYDAHHRQRLPGTEVRGEGDPPTGDPEVDEAYDGLGATYDLYWDVYQRNSIDDRGLPLVGTVHFGRQYDNAFWDGQQMNFGDGDYNPVTKTGTFNRFTIAVDIMGHELTHGVTQYESNLIYMGQPGALNESISDVFGSLVKQYHLRQTVDKADWLIGAGLLPPEIGTAIRSMKAPGTAYDNPALGGKDPQPAHMKDYVHGFQDNFGVHINSGIPNFAFYNCASALGGNAWDTAGLIWYQTCLSPLMRQMMRFQEFAQLTVVTARQLYGIGSPADTAVRGGWAAAGIGV